MPPRPVLDWADDGTPIAADIGDVYFSKEGGLDETRAVFLTACGLPDRWQGRAQFTVAELGFGTGLNLLALWQLWQNHRPTPDARLDFISFEGFPLAREDAERALYQWPEIKAFSDCLLANWPVRARGVQSIPLADGVRLIIHIDEIAKALPNSRFRADAWFLDGFAPSKNGEMWAETLYPLIRDRCEPGAYIGTYTVAGAVRRGLSAAGFEVSKQSGFGRKRERLQAIAPKEKTYADDPYGLNVARQSAKRIAILGGGIGGAAAAFAFANAGCTPVLFDRSDRLASGASGNRLALLMPRLDASDTPVARMLLSAYIAAVRAYVEEDGTYRTETVQRVHTETDQRRFAKLRADPPLPEDWLGFTSEGDLLHRGSLILDPRKLVADLTRGIDTRLGRTPEVSLSSCKVNNERFDAVIIASGMGLSAYPETAWLPLSGRLGQVETSIAETARTEAIAAGHYALSVGKTRLWGASFEPITSDMPRLSEVARYENQAALQRLVSEEWCGNGEVRSRAGIRATTPDKLPIAGPLPDFEEALNLYANVRHGGVPKGQVPVHEGIYLLGGLGARGFTFAPWLADLLTAIILDKPLPCGHAEAELVSPMRFIFRGLKRKEL